MSARSAASSPGSSFSLEASCNAAFKLMTSYFRRAISASLSFFTVEIESRTGSSGGVSSRFGSKLTMLIVRHQRKNSVLNLCSQCPAIMRTALLYEMSITKKITVQ